MKDRIFQGIFSVALTGLTVYFNILAIPLIVLFVFMVFDYVTGMYKALESGELSSRIGIEGIFKKLFYGVLVVVAMGVDYLIYSGLLAVNVNLSYNVYFGILVTIWLIINEMISILENLSSIGVPMPSFLIKIVKKLKITVDKESEDNNDD